MRVVEVERVAVERAGAVEHRQEAQTVDVGGQLVDAEDAGDRREEVVRRDQVVVRAAGLDDARPLDGQRHADAAFPDHRLAAAERVLRLELLEAAVVGVEDDDRPLGQAVLLDAVEDLAEAGVHRLDHRAHDRVVHRVVGAGLRLVLGDQLRVLQQRPVDDVVRDVEEERVVPVRVEEGERPIGDLAGVVGVGQRVVLVLGLDRGQDVVEALGGRVHRPAGYVLLVDVEVPLAEVAGGVALGLEQLGERDLLERQAGDFGRAEEAGVRVGAAGDVVGDLEACRVLAGHQAGPGRRADRVGRVGVRERHAGGGDGVDGRGLVVGRAVVADLVPGEVVGEEEDDVPGGCSGVVVAGGVASGAAQAARRRANAAMPMAVLWVRGSSDPPRGEAAERRSPGDAVAGFAGGDFSAAFGGRRARRPAHPVWDCCFTSTPPQASLRFRSFQPA